MKYYNPNEVKQHVPCGEWIWGTAFQFDMTRNRLKSHQPPIHGMLVADKQWPIHMDTMKYLEKRLPRNKWASFSNAFVPLKNGNPIWNKAVNLKSRCYADTEQEAIELYNELIRATIMRNQAINAKLENLIPPDTKQLVSIRNPNVDIWDFAQIVTMKGSGVKTLPWQTLMQLPDSLRQQLNSGNPKLTINGKVIGNADVNLISKTIRINNFLHATFDEITEMQSADMQFGIAYR